MTQSTSNIDLSHNPLGTKGFAFIEFAAEDTSILVKLFEGFGFKKRGQHKTKNVQLFSQGKVDLLINAEPKSYADEFQKLHGPSVPAMGWLMEDAAKAHKGALESGAEDASDSVRKSIDAPAIVGIGGSLIYFTDSRDWETEFEMDTDYVNENTAGLEFIDHLTHNVRFGNMDKWYGFYHDLFNFNEIRYFDIEGEQTGLVSRAITSPCGNITIPLNESDDEKSQINEYIERYNGEGIQHIAFHTSDICHTIDYLGRHGQKFLGVPDTYYEMLDDRVPNYDEQLEDLRQRGILVDGERQGKEYLLQLFTTDAIGPVFFEIISRKGHKGFGEGNFKALFEAIERDQIKRGYLNAPEGSKGNGASSGK